MTGGGCFGGTREGHAVCSYKPVTLVRGLGHLSPEVTVPCGLAGASQAVPAPRAGRPSGVEQGQRWVEAFLHRTEI